MVDRQRAEPTPVSQPSHLLSAIVCFGAMGSLTAYLNPDKVVFVEVGGTDDLVVEEIGCLGSSGLRPGRSTTA